MSVNFNTTLIEKIKYVQNEIRKNWQNRVWWKNRFIHYVIKNYYKKRPNKGTYVMSEDWDNLIILDACRYDIFVEVTNKKTENKISRGSSTTEFLQENFAKYKFKDTIYITANPFVNKLCKNTFYKIVPVWAYEWNEDFGTVFPEKVVKYALITEKKYPNKRQIIHFLQPHHPYIRDPEIVKICKLHNYINVKDSKDEITRILRQNDVVNPFLKIEQGVLTVEEVYNAYKRNLKAVIPHAFYLAKKLKGKTVITADHGEAFGEFAWPFPIRIYEHPPHVHIPVLVKVPWLVFDSKERKEINVYDEKQRLKNHIKKLKAKKLK